MLFQNCFYYRQYMEIREYVLLLRASRPFSRMRQASVITGDSKANSQRHCSLGKYTWFGQRSNLWDWEGQRSVVNQFFIYSHKFMAGDTTKKLAVNAMLLAKYGTAYESGPTAIGPTPTRVDGRKSSSSIESRQSSNSLTHGKNATTRQWS
jgi:hypothetical protein